MSVESVARDVVMNMNNQDKMMSMVAPDAMVSGGILPQPMPMMEAMKVMGGLMAAFPDLKFDIQNVAVNGDKATVDAKWTGTNTGPVSLPMPGMSSMPPTGKKVTVNDRYVVTVRDNKVSHFEINSPAGGGVEGAMAQLGVKMPGM
jgi:predicted ester cyclase